jgi:peptidoglycan/LPS O-acetylase OafA/YrhL
MNAVPRMGFFRLKILAQTKNQSRRRIDGIDILRGLSIFFVLMNHVNMRLYLSDIHYADGLPAQLASSLIWNGQRGVQIFFCISGFLIASTSIRRWGSLPAIKVRTFYLLRFARIAPLFLALLLLLSILHLSQITDFVISEKTGGLAGALFSALTFRINVLEATRGYLPANWDILWSLSVEELFYLIFPLACGVVGRYRLTIGLLVLLIGLGPFARSTLAQGNGIWEEYSYLGSMDAIAMGVLTALIASHIRLPPSGLFCCTIIGVSLTAFSLGCTKIVRSWGFNRIGIGMTILAIGTCLVIFAASQSRWRAPQLLYPLLKLGERSYEIYLTHMFVILGLFHLFVRIGSPGDMIPVLFLGSILFSGILGEIVARFFSEPLNFTIRRS